MDEQEIQDQIDMIQAGLDGLLAELKHPIHPSAEGSNSHDTKIVTKLQRQSRFVVQNDRGVGPDSDDE